MTDECKELAQAFPYPSAQVAALCEDRAVRVEEVYDVMRRFDVEARIEMGRCLNEVKAALPHGQFMPWLAWRLKGWSENATYRWRIMAERADRRPELKEVLVRFHNTSVAEEFAMLPEAVQDRIVAREAWTRAEYQAVCWRAAMDERLEDPDLDEDNRYGHVLLAIDEALNDEATPEPLREAARELYEAHRETFARLADEEPSHLDVQVGMEWREPDGKPSAQLVEGDEGYWLCRRITVNGREEFLPVAPVGSHVLLWDGEAQPSVLAAFPRTSDGPAAASWQRAGVRALCEKLGASTLARMYGDAL